MSKIDPLAKPFGMDEAEYQMRLRASRSGHRIYKHMINYLLDEAKKLPEDERDFAFYGAAVMTAEHLSRMCGGKDNLNREIKDARVMLKALRSKRQ